MPFPLLQIGMVPYKLSITLVIRLSISNLITRTNNQKLRTRTNNHIALNFLQAIFGLSKSDVAFVRSK